MMVNTIYGEQDETNLVKKTGTEDNEDARIDWVEYYQGDELVHRSAHVTLKRDILGNSVVGGF